MKLHVVYRSVASENKKTRPSYYSKHLCLLSFLLSVEPQKEHVDVTFLNDGPIPVERRGLMEENGQIVQLAGVGNFRSHRTAVSFVDSSSWRDEDLVYFAEDDYLYMPGAFSAFLAAAEEIPQATYFSFYDFPNWYEAGGDPLPRSRLRHFTGGGHSWRTVDSTTLSFGARVNVMRADSWLHVMGTRERPRSPLVRRSSGSRPADQATWRALQGFKPYDHLLGFVYLMGKRGGIPDSSAIRRFNLMSRIPRSKFRSLFVRRLLICATPALATHCEVPHMARGVDWQAVATKTATWAEQRGMRILNQGRAGTQDSGSELRQSGPLVPLRNLLTKEAQEPEPDWPRRREHQ
jgi:hypothetical protein